MTQSLSLFASPWMKALGWTFVHSIWQIAIIGLILFLILRFIPGRSAHTRYTISTMAIWMIVTTALVTFLMMLPQQTDIIYAQGQIIFVETTDSALTFTQQLSLWLETRMPMLLTIWLTGVGLLMLRLGLSIGYISHLRYESYHEETLEKQLADIIQRVKLKVKGTVRESGLVPSPVAIGHIKPLILFPIGLINQLSPREIEAVLTHELAHIVRRDYMSNLVQSFIETIFYYHPVMWWMSRIVRTERENRADDLAISWYGDHVAYAKALLNIQEMQLHHKPALALGFASRKGAMLARIQRILHLPYKHHNQMEKTVLLSLCSICFLAFTLTSHTPDNTPEKNEEIVQHFALDPVVVVDSIPSKGTYRIHKKTDAQDISIEVQDGDILELKVDGQLIDKAEYGTYDQMISELFGVMESPHPAVYNFGYDVESPAPGNPADIYWYSMPDMPPMPAMPAMPAFPEMPDMPGMRALELDLRALEKMNLDFDFDFDFEGSGIHLPPGAHSPHCLKFFGDSAMMGNATMIIIRDGDSSVITVPGGGFNYIYDYSDHEEGKEEWKAYAEQWREQAEELKEQYRERQNEYRELQGEYRDRERENAEHERERWRHQQDNWRQQELEAREHLRSLNEEWRNNPHVYVQPFPGQPRHSLSDEMVRDGLIEAGDEVEVHLTPDRLKINGKKMDDETHQKYLRMYERQQGVELGDNSKVEFTTKSKQRF